MPSLKSRRIPDQEWRTRATADTDPAGSRSRHAWRMYVAALMATLCFAAFALSPAPAASQEPESVTLLKSASTEIDSEASVAALRFGQNFSTGPNPAGYRLTSITIPFQFEEGTEFGRFEARIYESAGSETAGRTGSLAYTLQGPTEVSEDSFSFERTTQLDLDFTAPSGSTLEPSTDYRVEIITARGLTSGHYYIGKDTAPFGRTEGALGWTFADGSDYYASNCACYFFTNSQRYRVEIKGYALTGKPLPPRLLRSSSGILQVNLAWEPPRLDGGSAITGYLIEASDDAGLTWTVLVEDTGSADRSYSDSGLAFGVIRRYRVSAITARGRSEASATHDATISAAGLELLKLHVGVGTGSSMPRDFYFDAAGEAVAQAFRTGPSPAGYTAVALLVAGGVLDSLSSVAASLHADNDGVPGSSLAPLELVAADSDRLAYGSAQPLQLDPSTVYHVVATWAGGDQGLVVTAASPGLSGSSGWGPVGGIQRRASVGGPWSIEAGEPKLGFELLGYTAPGPPSAPQALTARGGAEQVDLSWDAPQADGGAAPTAYVIEESPDGVAWRQLATGTWATSYTHEGLYPGAECHYRVYAVNPHGRSPASEPTTARTRAGRVDTGDPGALISNLPRSATDVDAADLEYETVVASSSNVPMRSVAFTTGRSRAVSGYLLSDLLLMLRITDPTAELPAAAIHDDEGGAPAQDPRYVLTRSSTLPEELLSISAFTTELFGQSPQRYVAPSGAILRPATTYHVVFDHPAGISLEYYVNSLELGSGGWSLADRARQYQIDTGQWTTTSAGAPFIALRGAAEVFDSVVAASNEWYPSAGAAALSAGGPARAQAFTTGSQPVLLDWLALRLAAGSAGDLTVELRSSGQDGLPGAPLGQLQPGAAAGASGTVFTASQRIELEAKTTYFVVVRAERGSPALATTDSDDEYARDGWRLADGYRWQIGGTGDDWSPVAAGSALQLTIAQAPAGLLGPPLGLTATGLGGERIQLKWEAPAQQIGAERPVIAYRIEWSADGHEPWRALRADTGSNDTVYVDGGIAAGETRHYRVYTISDAGPSRTPSGTATATAFHALHLVSNLEQPTLEAQWLRLGGAGEPYGYAAQSFQTGRNGDGYALSGVALSLAEHTSGRLEAAVHVNRGGQPGGLLYRLASAVAGADGLVEFAAPAGATLAAQTRYHLVVRGRSGAYSVRTTASDAEDPGRAPGWGIGPALRVSAPGTQAQWGGHARSGLALAIQVRGLLRSVPAAPYGLRALTRGAHQIDLFWDEPYDGSIEITGYEVEVSTDGGRDWTTLVADTRSGLPRHQHQGLTRASTRSYRIRAINALGKSPPSAAATATTSQFAAPEATAGGDDAPLISNLNLAPGINLKLYRSSQDERDRGASHGPEWSRLSQAFSTGSLAAGFSAVRIDQVAIGPGERMALAIHSDLAGQPGIRVHELTGPFPESGRTKVFYARPDAVLEPQTSYHLVVRHLGGLLGIGTTLEAGERGRDGWRIADGSKGWSPSLGLAGAVRREQVLRFAISGYELPATPQLRDLTAAPASDSEIYLDWTVLEPSAALPVTGYLLEVSGDGQQWRELEPADRLTASEYRHEGLLPGSSHRYRVTPVTALGPAETSQPVTATTLGGTLVSNLTRSQNSALAPSSIYDAYAQAFSTGSADGVRLGAVELELGSVGSAGDLVAALHRDDPRGRPGAELVRLRAAGPLRAGRNIFLPPQPLRLEPATRYHLVLFSPSAGEFALDATNSGAEDANPAPGWSLADRAHGHERLSGRWVSLVPGAAVRAIKVRLTGWHPLSAPFIQDASAEGDGAIRVYWFSGTLTAGLTGYRVEFRSGPGGWRTLVDLDASAMTSGLLEYLHTGLEHGQEYFYRVRALSTGGPGLPSEALRATAVTSEDEDPGLNLPYGPAELLFGNSHQYSSYVSGNGVLRLADPDDSYLFPTVMRVAQGFRTGPNPRGYRLNAISLSVGRHDYDNQVGRIWRIDVKKVAEPLDPSLTHDEVEPTLEPLTLDFPSGAQVKSRPHPERRNGKLRFGRLDFDLDPNSYYYLIIDNVRGPQSLPAYYGQWELAATPDAARGRGRHLSRVPFFGLDGWSLMPYGLWIASQVARDELFNWSHFGEAETLGSGLKLTLHGQAHRAPIVEQTTGLLVYDMGRQLRQLRWNPSSIDGLRTRYTIQVDSGTPSCSDDAGWSDLVVTQEPSIALQTDRNCLRVRDQ